MPVKEKLGRNQQLFARWLEGWTLKEIARLFNISSQRVAQLTAKATVQQKLRHYSNERRRALRSKIKIKKQKHADPIRTTQTNEVQ